MTAMIASLVIVAIAIMVLLMQKQSVTGMKRLLTDAQKKTLELEQKISTSREELRKAKDELEREKGALRDARELNKKKLRRQASTGLDMQITDEAAPMSNKNANDSQKALQALEAQIEHMKQEQAHKEETLRARLAQESEEKTQTKNKEVDEQKKTIAELQEEIKKLKRLMRPEGHKIDLKSLPDNVAAEFARVFRKAEQHERLHGIARAKLHLAQEKFTELQKRYFSVCRELAVLSGGSVPASTHAEAATAATDHPNLGLEQEATNHAETKSDDGSGA